MDYCPLAKVNMNMNVEVFFVTIFSPGFMQKNLRKANSSHTNITENVSRYTTTARKAACKKSNPLIYATE